MGIQRLSSKNQIVIPKEARRAMNVKGGDDLVVVVKRDITIVMSRPKKYVRVLRGLGRQAYPRDYLARERRSWS